MMNIMASEIHGVSYMLKVVLLSGGYYYSNGVPTFTWLQAKQDCKARGMQLAKLDSQSDLDDAVAYMNSET